MNYLLRLLEYLYLAVTTCDRLFFRVFPFLVYRPEAKVISIGNLSMGGTGKTPVLFEILREYLENSPAEKVCVISRGYRSPWENSFYYLHGSGPHPPELTDEALLFNQHFEKVPLLLGKRRDRSARFAERKLQPRLLLLDDGFQYRRLKKDFEILLWDSHMQPAEAELIPRGKLREPVSRLIEADAILLTRCESASAAQIDFWQNWLAQRAPGVKIVPMQTLCEGLFDLYGQRIIEMPGEVIAMSAIGRPASFYQQLELIGLKVVHRVEFRDHHRFNEKELEKLAALHRQSGLPVVCTEKDRVKISTETAMALGLLTMRIRVLPCSGRSLISELDLPIS